MEEWDEATHTVTDNLLRKILENVVELIMEIKGLRDDLKKLPSAGRR